MTFIIYLETTIFKFIIKNLTKCFILKTFALKNNEKFADHNLEILCPLSLASTIPVLGLERVCPRKVGPWPWPRIFFESLASKVVSATPPLVIKLFYYPQSSLALNLTLAKSL